MALSDNLVAYWSLGEASGTRYDDHGSNDLTDHSVGSGTGKIGTCADFERTSDQYLSSASNSDLSTGDIDFTFACWVTLESKDAGLYWRPIFTKESGSGSGREWALIYDYGSDRFYMFVWKSGPTDVSVVANSFGSPSTGTWYFIVARHNAATDTLSICVNDGAVDSTAVGGSLQAAGTAEIRMGSVQWNVGDDFWDGLIDEFGFWKRCLTAGEITELYNSGSGRDYSYIISGGGGGISDRPLQFNQSIQRASRW